jgi:putative phosphoesterase
MLLAIISDAHNNLVNLKKVLNYCHDNNIQTIICCGDLASEETLKFVSKNFSGTFFFVFGNMDRDQLKDFKFTAKHQNIRIFSKFGETLIVKKKIAFTHYPNIAQELCESKNYAFVFYGHTHKPWTENINKCVMLNPGNVAGEIYPPTFAVWETDNDNFKLIRVHDLKQ